MSHRAILATAVIAGIASFGVCHRAVSKQPAKAPSVPPAKAPSAPPEKAPPEPPLAPPLPDDPAPLHTLMHRHFNDVRDIHQALLRGELRKARSRARRLAEITAPGELPGWESYVARIRRTAAALGRAPTPTRARTLLAQLATECGDCHEESADVSRFIWSAEPAEDGSPAGRMARHEWAAESVWMGLVGASDERWREGLDVLAGAPLLPEAYTDDRARHDEVDRYARLTATLAARARRLDEAPQRAQAFAELLGACSGCHTVTRK